MRLNAYLLLGDPAYLAASIASYVDIVGRIVISYDINHASWAGDELPIDECLAELKDLDARKLDLRPGSFSDPSIHPMECETRQRQAALRAAADGADWVLQLDSDEVAADPATLVKEIHRGSDADAVGLDYPSRWIYARLDDGSYLEGASRFWRPAAGYPGPLAVRSDVKLTNARQCDGDLFRVDFRSINTDPWRYRNNVPVHAVIPVDSAVLHFSWVRPLDDLRRKSRISGHSDIHWQIDQWRRRQRHPVLATVMTPLRGRGEWHPNWLRRTRLPVDPPMRVALT